MSGKAQITSREALLAMARETSPSKVIGIGFTLGGLNSIDDFFSQDRFI